ncbi:MAG: polysaccharide pyruvyl transferase family protein [Candidatus Mcinerneyibacterium aminivorans]|uniref:Polysaccharide pyruvyl transferase family protein n=1 Tax=Candidatus Mcinerneyibacterium aminivorans TaxID=2703815 RepID=A0A5D0ML26_9BACT|nr:MAG: polysaccharide pyruvyl transferase family protein [Candidatus Mcinerneyibacterium aminivorans]
MNNIVITGANFANKGAEAMLYTVVDQMKKKYPTADIFLLDLFPSLSEEEKKKYSFNIVDMGMRSLFRISNWIGKYIIEPDDRFNNEDVINEIMGNADLLVDISGYGINSQSSYFRHPLSYLAQIKLGKKYNVPIYILPQSLGPFDFSTKHKIVLYPLMQWYLKYPEKIFAREIDGVKALEKFTQKNVLQSYDVVLQTQKYDINNIFKEEYTLKADYNFVDNVVGIIPNNNLFKFSKKKKIYETYYNLIEELLEKDKEVYIIRHSNGDFDFCKKIKKEFKNNKSVVLYNDDYYPFQLEELISQLDYLVTSRYHGLVHGYKNKKPCLVIGWAIKYKRLMEKFNQGEFCFDCRDGLSQDEIVQKLDELNSKHKQYSKSIGEKIEKIKENNIFDKYF